MRSFVSTIKVSLLLVMFLSLFFAIIYAAKDPIFPCTIKTAGCYRNDDSKASFGELIIENFGYHLVEDKCIRQGSCDCRGIPENTVKEADPDQSGGACSCIVGAEWSNKAQCCGDDSNDCGSIKSAVLCTIDSSFTASASYEANQAKADIKYAGCSDLEFLSDGESWLVCNGSFWSKEVSNNEFICAGVGKRSIVECCGDKTCNSRIAGKRLSTGQIIKINELNLSQDESKSCTTIIKNNCSSKICDGIEFNEDECSSVLSTKTYNVDCDSWSFEYKECPQPSNIKSVSVVDKRSKSSCTSGTSYGYKNNVLWVDNGCRATFSVTVIGENQTFNCKKEACSNSTSNETNINTTLYCSQDGKFVSDLDNPSLKSTCEKSGFDWTGSKCCGDDQNEYYNDQNGLGGCWNDYFVQIFFFVNDTSESVINYNGEFHSCEIEKTNFNMRNNELSGINDSHTNATLVQDHEYCFNDPESKFFCSFLEKWVPAEGKERVKLSNYPINNLSSNQIAECCGQKQCWNGAECIESADNPSVMPIKNDFRCIDGNWTKSSLKYTPDGKNSGYCKKESQCLLNPLARNESGQCLDSLNYVSDYYCENGKWSSRTKLLAGSLLGLKQGDYSLFCDIPENALNYVSYSVGNTIASDLLGKLGANNVCILAFGNKVIFGTALDKGLDSVKNGYSLFGISGCINSTAYAPCDDSKKVWYDSRLKIIVHSKSSIDLSAASGNSTLDHDMALLLEKLNSTITPPYDDSYLNSFSRLNRIYLEQKSGRNIFASIDESGITNLVASYNNFDSKICDFLLLFNERNRDDFSGIACHSDSSSHYILAQGNKFTLFHPDSIWNDITSKLRIK